MPVENIESFLKRELGNEASKILNNFNVRYGVDDVASASEDIKKKFMSEIQPELNQKSFTRAQFLASELMSILGLKQVIVGSDEAEKIKKRSIKNFLNLQAEARLLKSFSKIEAIYNLFWSKAAETYGMGIQVNQIHGKCQQILGWLKNDLFSICDELESKLGVEMTANRSKMVDKFQFTGSGLARLKEKSPYYHMFMDFRAKIEVSFDKFYHIFMNSMDLDIELAKRKKSDEELIKETQKQTNVIWKEIVEEYKDLKRAVNSMISDEEIK